jgi:hypothetical protein
MFKRFVERCSSPRILSKSLFIFITLYRWTMQLNMKWSNHIWGFSFKLPSLFWLHFISKWSVSYLTRMYHFRYLSNSCCGYVQVTRIYQHVEILAAAVENVSEDDVKAKLRYPFFVKARPYFVNLNSKDTQVRDCLDFQPKDIIIW